MNKMRNKISDKVKKVKSLKKPALKSKSVAKKSSNNLSLYANLAHKRRTKKDIEARKKAEYLASLPKNPFLRFLYRLHPKRFFKYWFSKRGRFSWV